MKLKPKAGFIKNELNAERLTPLQWDGIMRAMDKYAFHFHDVHRQANGLEQSASTCNLQNVSNRRELFDKFYEWLDGLSPAEYDDMSLTDKCEKFFFKLDK